MNIRKLFEVIPNRRRKQFPLVAMAMVLGAAFEVVGISLIMPLLDIISGSESQFTEFISSSLGLENQQNVALVSVIAFALIYLSKGLYLSGLAWVNARFSYLVKADVSNKLMEKYLHAPYEFHLQKNSAQLIRNLTTEANQLVTYVLNPSLVIISEAFVVIAVGVFLLVVEPQGTIIVMSLLIVMSYAFQRILGGFSQRIGKIRQHTDGLIIQNSQESLGGIKDVKILGKEEQFFKDFQKNNLTLADSSAKQSAISQLPRMYLETIGVMAFSILILLLIIQGDDFSEVVPVLAVFALAAFRLLPSANRLLSSVNSLRFAESVITSLYEEMTMITPKAFQAAKPYIQPPRITFHQNIELRDVSYRYPKSETFGLLDINLTVRKGESIGVVGKSGSGKSTLSDLILGLLQPTTGVINVDGVSIDQNMKGWQRSIGYVRQDIFLLDDSIIRNIAFGEKDGEIDNDKITNAIKEAQLVELIESLPEGINTRLGERGVRLSGGQKQRIGIARALYRNAPILIFDEATSALDNETEAEIVSAIKNLKGTRTMVVIAHRLSTIEHCDRVVELKNGRIHKIDTRS
jgi:ABC-type multidrug transport system fused ATPase/permease subunit